MVFRYGEVHGPKKVCGALEKTEQLDLQMPQTPLEPQKIRK
jgi:hypothetical protein